MQMRYLFTIIVILSLTQCQCKQEYSLTVGSFNIRYKNTSDSIRGNGWNQRGPVIADMVRFNDFDIIGAQEVLNSQIIDLQNWLPEYNFVGVGRDDGDTKGEYAPIYFKKDKFSVENSGHFWLSDITDKPNKGWDAALPRICTWVKLKTPDRFSLWVFNLHMDHVGIEARKNSAKLVIQKIEEMCGSDPVIVTGDFNVDQHSDNYAILVNSGILKDSYEEAEIRYALNGTFNDFNPNMKTESRIDHIFVSNTFKVDRYGILTDTYRMEIPENKEEVKSGNFPDEVSMKEYLAKTPSDHFPVKILVKYK